MYMVHETLLWVNSMMTFLLVFTVPRMLIYGAVAATALEAPSQQTWAGGFMSGAFGADVLRWIYLRYCNINVNMVTANSCFQLCASS